MSLIIQCPRCGAQCRVRTESAGAKVRCAACRGIMIVPRASNRGTIAAPPPLTPSREAAGTNELLGDLLGGIGGASEDASRATGPVLSGGVARARGGVSRPRRRGATKRPRRNALWLAVGGVAAVILLSCTGITVAIKAALDRKLYSTQVAGPRASISATQSDLLRWAPDAEAQNFVLTAFDRYSIRLPPGYVLLEATPSPLAAPPGGKSHDWTWVSPPTPRGTRHIVDALLFDVGRMVDAQRFFEAHLPEYVSSIQKRASQVRRIERGILAGRFALRVDYSSRAADGRVANSIELFWFDGQCMINLRGTVPEADGLGSFDVMKRVLLTLDVRR